MGLMGKKSMSYNIEDASERNFARTEEAEADRMEREGLCECSKCGNAVEEGTMRSVYLLHSYVGKHPLLITTHQKKVCRRCAPACVVCDGLLDDATLWERGLRGPLEETQAGMSVAVNTPDGSMHGGCAAALMLGEVDGEDLATLSKDDIAAAYTRMLMA